MVQFMFIKKLNKKTKRKHFKWCFIWSNQNGLLSNKFSKVWVLVELDRPC